MSGATPDDYVTTSTGVDGLPSEVSWQTCFFILATLALNTMVQPGGSICSADPRYSTYLRSSPFFCIADVLSVLFGVSYKALKSKISLREGAQEIIDDRFETHGSVDGMESLSNTAWMRWLCFILGPLPQAIRLASFQGVPFTQIWGFCYVSSWLLVEIMVFISWWNKSRHPGRLHANGRVKYFSDFADFNTVDGKLVLSAATCQLSSATIIPYSIAVYSLHDKLRGSPMAEVVILLIGGICSYWMYVGIFIWCFRSLKSICEKNLAVSQNLLVAFPERGTVVLKFDEDALFLLVVSAASFLSWLVAYCYCYSPSGTINPGWTAVFG